tara:strand:+ start:522 stop:974 length:453 start_codon:yes stop_codon:yes gene_type:complete
LLKSLVKFFEKDTVNNNLSLENNLTLLTGLMIEAADSDGSITNEETNKIHDVLVNTFSEDSKDVKKSIEVALQQRHSSKSLFFFTSKINKIYSNKDKIILIEALWEIVLSDGDLHDYESSLIRRLSGLLYVSDIESGNARKRALSKKKMQ